MEIMEDGNLLDRVRILLQRDSSYYEQNQNVLQEELCSGVTGGTLDFPHHASFAAVKMVTWWEQMHMSVFGVPSGLIHEMMGQERSEDVGSVGVGEFVSSVNSCCEQLLAHLHTLSQEALDHADLQVLTSTAGAAAVVANALWVYNHSKDRFPKGMSFANSLREFQGMCEALAERLLDLHCRLISLYVLQDADCLNWEAQHPFFESERGSFVIQMWWLYMQGTREDLWNTVPPKTAQRVFAGMLNESLTILSVRYSQAVASSARQPLIVNDICNLLTCVADLLPALCTGAKELTGEKAGSEVVSHIHDKCHLLLCCLLFKGAPLSKLYKKFFRGLSTAESFKQAPASSISPWFAFVCEDIDFSLQSISELDNRRAISLEVSILNSQPHPSWGLLLKVLMMRNCWVAATMLKHLFEHPRFIGSSEEEPCKGFMCNGDCYLPLSNVEQALVHVITAIGNKKDVEGTLLYVLEKKGTSWAAYLDRNQIWNQKRPGWLEALIVPLFECLKPAVEIIELATKEGASIEDLKQLSVGLLVGAVDCLPPGIHQCACLLEGILPADSRPLADSVLVQMLFSALYSHTKDVPLGEALCNLDLSLLQDLLQKVRDLEELPCPNYDLESSLEVCELRVSQLLFSHVGRKSLKIIYKQLKEDNVWLLEALNQPVPRWGSNTLLYTMFHIGHKQFDRILSGQWVPDWEALLKIQLGVSQGFAWGQMESRLPADGDEHASHHDKAAAQTLRKVFRETPEGL